MYYKAYVYLTRVNLFLNEETNEYEGCDPLSHRDLGHVLTLQAESLDLLKSKIEKNFFNLEKPIGADVQIFDGEIEIQYEGELDYRVPKNEQIPFIETARIVISKIDETYLDLSNEELFNKINKG